MSRRHPLSSIRALGRNAPHQKRAARPLQRRAGKLPAISVRRDLLLLDPAGLLRGLLHCALRLLLRFLSHIALRLDGLVAACIRESKCTSFRIHQRVEKNSVPLKEVLTCRRGAKSRASIEESAHRAQAEAENPRKACIGEAAD